MMTFYYDGILETLFSLTIIAMVLILSLYIYTYIFVVVICFLIVLFCLASGSDDGGVAVTDEKTGDTLLSYQHEVVWFFIVVVSFF